MRKTRVKDGVSAHSQFIFRLKTQVLAPELFGFSSFYSFQNHYAHIFNRSFGARSFRQVVGYQNLDELSDKVDGFSFRVLKKECLDLPSKVYERRDVELTPQQRKMYKELKEYAFNRQSACQVPRGSDEPSVPSNSPWKDAWRRDGQQI